MAALIKLQDQGKIRAIGVSNYDVDWIEGRRRRSARQPATPYSLIQRKIEKEILPTCRETRVGVIGTPRWSGPTDRRRRRPIDFPPGDHRTTHKFFRPENRNESSNRSKRSGRSPTSRRSLAQMVINWTIQVPGITAAIVGARNAEQAEHNTKALSFRLSPEECAQIRLAFDATSATLMAS